MRLVLIAVGGLKAGPERQLVERYRERFDTLGRRIGFGKIELCEIPEGRAREDAARVASEATAIAALVPDRAVIVALDERGKNLDSAALAQQLLRWREDAPPAIAFLIGGADGLSPDLRRKAKLTLAFGAATWPHQIVRVMLLEQLYRAATILLGHPYHRGG